MNDNKLSIIFLFILLLSIVLLIFFLIFSVFKFDVKTKCIATNKTYVNVYIYSEDMGVEYCGYVSDFEGILNQYVAIQNGN